MKEKWTYIVLGLMAGLLIMMMLGQPKEKPLWAADSGIDSMSGNGMIALTSPAPGNPNKLLLWIIDTREKKLLLYDYLTDTSLVLKAMRDIKYDVNIPDGVSIVFNGKNQAFDINRDRDGARIKRWTEAINNVIRQAEEQEKNK